MKHKEDYLYFKVNGSNYYESQNDFQANNIRLNILHGSILADLNGTSDYVTASVYMDVGSGSPSLLGGTGSNMFMGLRISAT